MWERGLVRLSKMVGSGGNVDDGGGDPLLTYIPSAASYIRSSCS